MKWGILFVIMCRTLCLAGEAVSVESIFFPTRFPPPAFQVPPAWKEHWNWMEQMLKVSPEGVSVQGALSMGSRELGLTPEQGNELSQLMTKVYQEIAKDPAFSETPSALSYSYATTQQRQGHYFLIVPPNPGPQTKTVIFLHGFGGNFLFYPWVLKRAFPEAVILCPTWSISWVGGSDAYLQDLVRDAQKRTGVRIQKPWLLGLSAGGRGGFPLYNQHPDRYQGFICIANAPTDQVIAQLKPDLNMLMLNGTEDKMVPVNIARKQAAKTKRKVPGFQYQELKGNHFFLLTQEQETIQALRQFMGLPPERR